MRYLLIQEQLHSPHGMFFLFFFFDSFSFMRMRMVNAFCVGLTLLSQTDKNLSRIKNKIIKERGIIRKGLN